MPHLARSYPSTYLPSYRIVPTTRASRETSLENVCGCTTIPFFLKIFERGTEASLKKDRNLLLLLGGTGLGFMR